MMPFKKIYFLLIIALLTCNRAEKNKLNLFELRFTYDFNTSISQPNYKDIRKIMILEYQDMFMYILKDIVIDSKYSFSDNGKPILKSQTRNTILSYYVIKKGFKLGLNYTSFTDLKSKSFRYDSLMQKINLSDKNLEFNENKGELLQLTKIGNSNNLLIEKLKFSKPERDFDFVFRLYNSRMKSVPLSIAPNLDKEKNSKLIRLTFIKKPTLKNGIIIPKEEMTIE
ncbi:MAG: hypothetical protein REI93_11980, partial [Pedobacter sp.]|nr:hypothetical protein [Pedobacter sp.]